MLSQWEELEAHVEKYSTHADMKQVAEDMIAKVGSVHFPSAGLLSQPLPVLFCFLKK